MPGIEAGDVAAQAVPDQPRRLIRRIVLQQRIEIGDVIGKPVSVIVPLRQAKAAPVGRHHPPVACRASTTNCQDAETSHQPCSSTSRGAVLGTPATRVQTPLARRQKQRTTWLEWGCGLRYHGAILSAAFSIERLAARFKPREKSSRVDSKHHGLESAHALPDPCRSYLCARRRGRLSIFCLVLGRNRHGLRTSLRPAQRAL